MITAFLVEDEESARLQLKRLLAKYPGIRIVGEAGSLKKATQFLTQEMVPDLLFLDIGISGGSGLDLLIAVDRRTRVIFVTAHADFALKAFEAGALDYLLKPIDEERLGLTLRRVKEIFLPGSSQEGTDLKSTDDPEGSEEGSDREISHENQGKKVRRSNLTPYFPLEEILWIESLDNYSRVKIKGESQLSIFRKTLSEWEEELSAKSFIRISRSEIIHLGLLRWTEWRGRNEMLLSFEGGDTPLVIGRQAANRLREIRG